MLAFPGHRDSHKLRAMLKQAGPAASHLPVPALRMLDVVLEGNSCRECLYADTTQETPVLGVIALLWMKPGCTLLWAVVQGEQGC